MKTEWMRNVTKKLDIMLTPWQHPNICRINNDNIKISIVMNYYAKESTVQTALEKLAHQSYKLCSPEEVEIMIIDDGTEGEKLPESLAPNIHYIWQRKFGYGLCRAKNTGAKLANGRYLIFLDADLMVAEGYIDAILKGFETYGERIVQCGYVWDYHFKGCPDPRTEFGVWENPNCLTERFYQVAGGNLAIPKSLFLETNGFDEDLIYGGVEDLLFGYHLSHLPRVGVFFNKEMAVWHIPHPPSPAHANPQKSWEIVKQKYPEFYEDYIVKGLR